MNLKQFRAQYPQYDDLSDQELATGLHKKFYSDIPFDAFLKQVTPAPEADTGFFDMAGRAVVRGAKQTGSLLADVLPAMVGKAVGADEYVARQMAEAAETQKEIQEKYAPRYGQLSDVKGIGDVLPFVTETVLEQVPNIATAVVPGVGGAVTGGRMAATAAAKKAAEREVAEAVAKRYAAQAAATGAGRGALGGAFLGSYALNAPEIFQNIEQETGQLELGASLIAGSVAAALDSILPAYLVKQFTPGMKAGVVEKILEKSGMPAGIARGATSGLITGAVTEAPTEAAQEAISIAAEKFVQENPDIWGSKEFNRLVESFVRGGAGGGGISGVAGGVKGYMERPRPTKEIVTGESAFDQLDAGEVEEVGVPAGASQDVLFPKEPEQVTPTAPTENSQKIKELRQQIALTKGEIRKLEEARTDEATMSAWYGELESLQAQERALRRGEAESSGVLRAAPLETIDLSPVKQATDRKSYVNGVLSIAQQLPDGAIVTDPDTNVSWTIHKRTTNRGVEVIEFDTGKESFQFEKRPDADWKLSGDLFFPQNPVFSASKVSEPSEILRAPSAREEALRMIGKTPEEIQAKREEFGEPGKKYEVTPDEAKLTTTDFVNAGIFDSEAEAMAKELRSGRVTGKTKTIANRVASGMVLFPEGWRAPTDKDAETANEFTKARYERARQLAKQKSQGTLLAQQMGLDLAPAEEGVSREFVSPIAMSEREFELTASEGQVAPEVQIETEEAPPAAPLNLVKRDINRLKEMLGSLQPSVQAEQGVKNYQAAINNFLDEVNEYITDAGPTQRKENIGLINEFFNRLGLTSDPKLAKNLVEDLKGKTAEQQSQIFAQRTRMPNLTSPTGLAELRAQFQDFMEQQNVAKLGEFPGSAATRTFAKDAYIPVQVANILRELRSRPEKFLNPQERAFMAYMSKFRYGLAMRSAAYDLANDVPMGDMFSGQGAKSAELFQKFVEENFPAQTFTAFNETIAEYKRAEQRAARAAEVIDNRQKERKAYLKQLEQERAEVAAEMRRQSQMEAKRAKAQAIAGKETERMEDLRKTFFNADTLAGNFKPLHPAVEQRLADGDLDGALDLIEQFPGAKYWKLLATRLRALNLDTVTQVDAQDRLMRYNLAKIAKTTDKLVNNIQVVYPEVYAEHIAPAINEVGEIDIRAFAKGLKAIKDKALLGEQFNESLQFAPVLEAYSDAVKSLNAPGFYIFDSKTNVINLNTAEGGNSYYALFHELIHAATAHAIRNPDKLDKAQKQALDNLKDLYAFTVKNHPDISEYGLLSLDEFIAEAFSNREFQNILSRLPYKTAEGSVWSKFIQYVRRLIGGKDTVLFGTLANADVLMSASQVRPVGGNKYGGTLMGPAMKVKRTSDGSFRTAPDMRQNRRLLDSVVNRPTWDKAKGGVKQMLENVSDATRKHFLGAFTLRQLQDMIGTRLGMGARNFILSVEGMLEEHNKIIDEAKKTTERWTNLQAKSPQESKDTSDLMIDSTLAGVDPDTQPKKDPELTRRWNALSDEAKTIYREVRDFYKRRMDEYKATLLNNIRLSLIASNTPDNEIKQTLAEVEAAFNKDLVGPYFPLRRFGQYWINIGKGPDKGFYMFDTAAERNAASQLFRQRTRANADFQEGNSLREADLTSLQEVNALEEINKAIDKATDSVLDGTYTKFNKATGSATDNLRSAIKDSVKELYLLTLPTKSLRRNFVPRKGVSGASQDMLRAFSETSSHMAYQHARFKFSRQMFDQLGAADQVHKANQLEGKPDSKVDGDYLNELYRRLDYVMNPTDTGTLPTVLSNVSFLWYLTAPASALVNMLGIPAFGLPVLSARFGKIKAAAMLSSTAKQFMTAGFKDKDGKFSMPSISMTKLSPEERAAYDIFASSGLIDITQAYDLAGLAESPSNMYTGKMSTIMRWGSFMFHHAERFNREVMAMSTFKLAYKAAKDAGLSDAVAFNKAIDQAKDLTYRSMFDYSSLNKPRYLQNAYAKVILQFKQFPQHMTYLLVRSTFEWFSKNNPELREEVRRSLEIERAQYGLPAPKTEQELEAQIDAEVNRIVKEGRGRLLGTLGMTFLFAGATGLPLFSVMSATIEAVYAAFADDDEPPLEFENWFKNWMAETFGNFWGDAVSRGVVTQATGMNFADRMTLNDLWFRDPRTSQDEVTAFQNMVFNLLGPTASLGISAAEALKLYNDGHYYRAAEKILPAVMRQPLVGARYATEGALTLKGDELVSGDEISAKDALSQSLGFSPEKVAQRQKANIEQKTAEQEIISKRQDLLNAFFMGVDTSDNDLMDRVLDKIDRFNNMYPSYPITGKTLTRSIRTRYKARALAELTGGIPINKNLMAELEDMGFYGNLD